MNSARKILFSVLTILLVIILVIVGLVSFNKAKSNQAKKPRIVATTMAVVQIADKLDLTLVGVPKSENPLPTKYKNVTKVGSPMSPNVEKIASLKPTVVYSVSVLKDQYDTAFKKQKFNAQYLDLDTVADLKNVLTSMGNQYDRQSQATKQIKIINNTIKTVKNRQTGQKPRVLILMGMPGAGYMIATNHSYVGDLVRLAGGQNVYTDPKQPYLAPENESLATKQPDVILRLEHAMPEVVKPQFDQEFETNSIWAQMPAVQNHRVYDLQQPDFNATANMNVRQALLKTSNWLYPAK
ncbi:iron ABC transporter substrate-binding protein [Paucilactobacillus hokkaidonensis JCM 18461]|uniref:High-affinity heme uptake system protein IsdE n=2 Tax=Paucilactobacillus hokkaidonensis TaxID=1193095 RepID=A0A0A1GW85_9LACO|nr:heme ABC transporter substrate-binding protein IsdE [Paucilactobacillus hokkaidonensis]KRO10239.1 iron compound ABC transporter substrate-binding component [Paucilactobacillus hokkaidonensis]BAP86255.1 iron ABC transporter substrate-binding protein [Paucilactobacillus hokkaidonensis JCM 18461]